MARSFIRLSTDSTHHSGGTHLSAFKEAVSRTIKEFLGKAQFEYSDIRNGMVAAIALKVEGAGV